MQWLCLILVRFETGFTFPNADGNKRCRDVSARHNWRCCIFYLLFLIENRGCLQLMCILVYLLTANAMNFTSDIVEKKGEIECLV